MALLLAAGTARADIGGMKPFSAQLDSGAVFVKETGFGHGWRYGGGVFFRTGKRAGVEILLERFGVPVEEGAAGLVAGRMDMTSLLINQHLFFLSRGRILPYAIIGVGFCFIGFSPDDAVVLPEKDFVDRLALQLGGGLDYRISSRLAITGKVRYNMVKTWVETLPRTDPIRNTDPTQQNILHLYALAASLGLKLSF
jgi:opacity protein-like surface antigen